MKTTVSRLTLVFAGLILISLMLAGISYAKIDPETAVGIWLFDDGTGDVATDHSGKGNDGTLKNAKWVEGKFGKALEFNGTDACVQTEQKLLDGLSEFTIVTWVKPGNITANRVGLVGQNDSPEFGFIDPNNVNLWTPTAGGLSNPYNHPEDEWHHVGTVASTTFTKVYIDGEAVEQAGAYANHGSSNFNVNIGGCGVWDPDGNWYTGAMDEVAIFHAALENGDIETIMNDGLASAVGITAVSPARKLATSWGKIKNY
jgi:hypothetical protein